MEGVANFDFFDLKDRWAEKIQSSTQQHTAHGSRTVVQQSVCHQAYAPLQCHAAASCKPWKVLSCSMLMGAHSCSACNSILCNPAPAFHGQKGQRSCVRLGSK
jgi:hypothetical protein